MVRGKETGGLSGADAVTTMAELIAPLANDEIEKLTIEAIREHREAVARAETAYEVWKSADAASAQTATLHEDYTKLMLVSRVQQTVVATLIERLGYVPAVPEF